MTYVHILSHFLKVLSCRIFISPDSIPGNLYHFSPSENKYPSPWIVGLWGDPWLYSTNLDSLSSQHRWIGARKQNQKGERQRQEIIPKGKNRERKKRKEKAIQSYQHKVDLIKKAGLGTEAAEFSVPFHQAIMKRGSMARPSLAALLCFVVTYLLSTPSINSTTAPSPSRTHPFHHPPCKYSLGGSRRRWARTT